MCVSSKVLKDIRKVGLQFLRQLMFRLLFRRVVLITNKMKIFFIGILFTKTKSIDHNS